MPLAWERLIQTARLGRNVAGQRRLPFRPLERLQEMQSRRVRAMVAYAYETVPYYRDVFRQAGLLACCSPDWPPGSSTSITRG